MGSKSTELYTPIWSPYSPGWSAYYRQVAQIDDDKHDGFWVGDGWAPNQTIPDIGALADDDNRRSGPEQSHFQSYYGWNAVSNHYKVSEEAAGISRLPYFYLYGEYYSGRGRTADMLYREGSNDPVLFTEIIDMYPNREDLEMKSGTTFDGVIIPNGVEEPLKHVAASSMDALGHWKIKLANGDTEYNFAPSLRWLWKKLRPAEYRKLPNLGDDIRVDAGWFYGIGPGTPAQHDPYLFPYITQIAYAKYDQSTEPYWFPQDTNEFWQIVGPDLTHEIEVTYPIHASDMILDYEGIA